MDDILAAPDDDGPRLAYAENCGDEERAEVIRLQCQVAAMWDGDSRRQKLWDSAQDLLKKNFDRWFGDLAELIGPGDFWRGFVRRVHASVGELARHADRLSEVCAEFSVYIPDGNDGDADPELIDHPLLRRIRGFYFDESCYAPDAFRLMVSPQLTGLEWLSFHEPARSTELVRLIDEYLPPTVRSLSFYGHMHADFDEASTAELSASPRVAQLRSLWLSNCKLRAVGAHRVANGTFDGLESLRFGPAYYLPNKVGPDGVRAIANGSALTCLQELDLNFNEVGDDGVRALAASSSQPFLEKLHLGVNDLTDDAVTAICGAPLGDQLTMLDLTSNKITANGVKTLLKAAPAHLTHLSLKQTRIGDEGARLLAGSAWLAGLAELDLCDIGLTDDGLRALAKSRYLSHIPTVRWRQSGSFQPETLAAAEKAFGESDREWYPFW